MARSFKLPDLGEGIHEGEVLAVLVSVGDEVKEGDPILEVETDKAAVEIPSPFTAKVLEILAKVGDTVHVGDVLIRFEGNGVQEAAGEKEEERPAPAAVRKPDAAVPAPPRRTGPVPASPATRRLARELGVDLSAVTPSGPAGLVTAEDVRVFAEKAAPSGPASRETAPPPPAVLPSEERGPALPDFSKWGPVERVPLRSVRKATARQMALAWSQIPHVYSQDAVDVTQLEAFRKRHKADVEKRGGRLTFTVFMLKTVATALKTYPNFNTTLDTGAGEIILKHYYHVGVAVNTDDGLIVPVIRDVDRKSILELAVELQDLVARTRERKIALEELQGGTFTITNVGPMGGGYFAPIINYPQVAILGMGAARMQAVVHSESEDRHLIVPRLMMPLVLSIDHRVLDGADALRFLRLVVEALEDPDELLMTMV